MVFEWLPIYAFFFSSQVFPVIDGLLSSVYHHCGVRF